METIENEGIHKPCSCYNTRVLCQHWKTQICWALRRALECQSEDEAKWIYYSTWRLLQCFNATPGMRALSSITGLINNTERPKFANNI
jgi:hypothetical protein